MKIQAKDCAQGGIFQMEVERGDNTRTRVVHRLAGTDPADPATAFYFDNPNFRARIGQFLGDDCVSVETGPPSQFCVQVSARVNIANGLSEDFLVRDSAQVRDPHPPAGVRTGPPRHDRPLRWHVGLGHRQRGSDGHGHR